ncbi:MAG: ribosomal protein S18-alanine N-acetyltransferase [Oscillospiraceae bacterium]|nr:ribosomal protein S18-alanine N-acetyltransferase [Oscillospiraceae bacterium]
MTEADIPAVIEIEHECFTSEQWNEVDFIYRLGDRETFISLVAEDNGKVVGYIAAAEIPDEYYLDSIAVTADYRKKGIATRLMEEAFDVPEFGVTLEVRESNVAAIGLYVRNGFYVVSCRRSYYDNPVEDAIVMRRSEISED